MLINFLSSGGTDYPWLKAYADAVIKLLLEKGVQISSSNSEGGYLSVFEHRGNKPPVPEYLIACGTFPYESRGRYMYNSIEKSVRLDEHIISDNHSTSRQSAKKEGEYPGAIYSVDEGRIFSFSGLLPLWDEFISILSSCITNCLRNSMRVNSTLNDSLARIPFIFEKRLDRLLEISQEEKKVMIEAVKEVVALRPHLSLAA
jgi:hypothetical protein